MSSRDSDFERALKALEAGDWEAAHVIVQEDPSELAAWAHGIVHLLEGDRDNAAYWYRRAQRALPAGASDDKETTKDTDKAIDTEIAALRAFVESR